MGDYPFYPKIIIDGEERQVKIYKKLDDGIISPMQLYMRQPRPYIPPDPSIYNDIDRLLEKRPFYIAHRAGGKNWVEFSETAIRNTANRFYRAVELSVWRCASGEFMVSHDNSMARTTGVDVKITESTLEELKELRMLAYDTDDPYQDSEQILTLDEAMDLSRNMVVFIDPKWISGNPENITTEEDLQNLRDFFEYLDYFEDGLDRFVIKLFVGSKWLLPEIKQGTMSKPYQIWMVVYGDEINQVTGTSGLPYSPYYELIGLEYNAPAANYNIAKAADKLIVAHIVINEFWVPGALDKGADGIMCSIPKKLGP